MFIYRFRTFDEARYSHHLIHFTWTALLLLSKAKVQRYKHGRQTTVWNTRLSLAS